MNRHWMAGTALLAAVLLTPAAGFGQFRSMSPGRVAVRAPSFPSAGLSRVSAFRPVGFSAGPAAFARPNVFARSSFPGSFPFSRNFFPGSFPFSRNFFPGSFPFARSSFSGFFPGFFGGSSIVFPGYSGLFNYPFAPYIAPYFGSFRPYPYLPFRPSPYDYFSLWASGFGPYVALPEAWNAPPYADDPGSEDVSLPAAPQPRPSTRPALVSVRVPAADAEVWFNDRLTQQTGTARSFQSPPLTPNGTYAYRVTARWLANGRPVLQTRHVLVRAGGQ